MRPPEPLWRRALDAREAEQRFLKAYVKPKRGGNPRGRTRIYPKVQIGDRFGDREVIELLPPRWSNEMVRVVCPRGHQTDSLVYNLRRHPGCGWCQRAQASRGNVG